MGLYLRPRPFLCPIATGPDAGKSSTISNPVELCYGSNRYPIYRPPPESSGSPNRVRAAGPSAPTPIAPTTFLYISAGGRCNPFLRSTDRAHLFPAFVLCLTVEAHSPGTPTIGSARRSVVLRRAAIRTMPSRCAPFLFIAKTFFL